MDIAQLRQDIGQLLRRVETFRIAATIPDNVNGATAVIYPEEFTYHATYDGTNNPVIVVQFVTPKVATVAGQTLLDGWVSTGTPDSAVDAIEADGQGRFRADQLRNYGVIAIGGPDGPQYYSAEVTFQIMSDD